MRCPLFADHNQMRGRMMAWKEEKVKWISQGHLSRFYFPLNNIRKMDTNNVNHKPDKGSKRQYIRQGKGIRRSTWKKFIGPLNNNIITTVALNIQYYNVPSFMLHGIFYLTSQ